MSKKASNPAPPFYKRFFTPKNQKEVTPMIHIEKHLAKLGCKVKDRVTGLEGVVTHVGFDLYGCIQVIVHPGLDEKGVARDTCWFDIARLEVISGTPVMDVPNFDFGPIAEGGKGPGEKPMSNKM